MNFRSLTTGIIMGALILTAGTAVARPGYDNHMYTEVTKEQEEKIVKLSAAYQKEISPLIEEEHAKKMEFYALTAPTGLQNNGQLARLEELSEEIAAINTELRDKKVEFQEAVYEATGIFMSGGMHHGSTCQARGEGYTGGDI